MGIKWNKLTEDQKQEKIDRAASMRTTEICSWLEEFMRFPDMEVSPNRALTLMKRMGLIEKNKESGDMRYTVTERGKKFIENYEESQKMGEEEDRFLEEESLRESGDNR